MGGVERYLDSSLPLLSEAGHDVRLWHEEDELRSAKSQNSIRSAAVGVPVRGLRRIGKGSDAVVASVADWKPNVICVHSPLHPALQLALVQVAPCIYFAHAYEGTCVTGSKTLRMPTPRPCTRTLGPSCLLHFYPHRCGGLNPIRAVRDFARSVAQLENIRRYPAIVAFSAHMRDEYLRHGVDARRLHLVPGFGQIDCAEKNSAHAPRRLGETLTIGFIGRLVAGKGVDLLLDSLPQVARTLDRRIRLVIAGSGRQRRKLEAQARQVGRDNPGIEIDFGQWIDRDEISAFYSSLDLLAVPSVWPEPFGLVGLEAASHGLPVAAFAVGGIPDWLRDGVNGSLAPGNPPDKRGIAEAIVRCLENPVQYAALCRGAFRVASEFTAERHIRLLEELLDEVAVKDDAILTVAHE